MDHEVVSSYLPALLNGLGLTLILTLASMIAGTILGFALAMMRLSRFLILGGITTLYGTLVRGLPLLIQILLVYFGLPLLTGIRMPAVVAGAVALSLFTAGYMAEVIRSGIVGVDPGQMEAGRSIGFSYWQSMRLIVLPQAFRMMIPNIANQFSITLKDTSLLSVIGVVELTMAGQTIYALNFDTIRVLAMVGALYLLVFFAAERLSSLVEARIRR
jgi:glutamine transport system permease protein